MPRTKSVRVRLTQRPCAVGSGHRVAGVDVGNTGGKDGFGGVRQQKAGVDEDVLAAQALRDPGRRVAQVFEPAGGLDFVVGGQALQSEAPDPDRLKELGQVAAAITADSNRQFR